MNVSIKLPILLLLITIFGIFVSPANESEYVGWLIGGNDGKLMYYDGRTFEDLSNVAMQHDISVIHYDYGMWLLGETADCPYDKIPAYEGYNYIYYPPYTDNRLVRADGTLSDISNVADRYKQVPWSIRKANINTIASGVAGFLIGGDYQGIHGGTRYGFLLYYDGIRFSDITSATVGKLNPTSSTYKHAFFETGDFTEWTGITRSGTTTYQTVRLNVTTFNSNVTEWSTSGTSPWLDSADSTWNTSPEGNFVSASVNPDQTKTHGNWTFDPFITPSDFGSLSSVVLKIRYTSWNWYPFFPDKKAVANYIKLMVWNGTTWHSNQFMVESLDWAYTYWIVTDLFDTLASLNQTQLKLSATGYSGGYVQVDYAYLEIKYVPTGGVTSNLNVETVARHSGAYGAHVKTDNSIGGGYVYYTLPSPKNRTLIVESYIKVLSVDYGTISIIGLYTGSSFPLLLRIRVEDSEYYWNVKYFSGYGGPEYSDRFLSEDIGTLNLNQWYHVKVELKSHQAGYCKVYIGNNKLFDSGLIANDVGTEGKVKEVDIGMMHLGGTWKGEIYFDNCKIYQPATSGLEWGPPVYSACWYDSYWLIGAESGVYKYTPGTETFTKIFDTLARVMESNGIIVLVGTDNGLYEYDGSMFSKLTMGGQSDKITDIKWNGKYWLIVTDADLFKYDGEAFTDLSAEPIVDYPELTVRDHHLQVVAWSPQSQYWLLGGSGSLLKYDGVNFYDLSDKVPFAVTAIESGGAIPYWRREPGIVPEEGVGYCLPLAFYLVMIVVFVVGLYLFIQRETWKISLPLVLIVFWLLIFKPRVPVSEMPIAILRLFTVPPWHTYWAIVLSVIAVGLLLNKLRGK